MFSEDDTFKRLRGISIEEIEELRVGIYCEISIETGSGAVKHSAIRERLDPILKPFGTDYDSYQLAVCGEEMWEQIRQQ